MQTTALTIVSSIGDVSIIVVVVMLIMIVMAVLILEMLFPARDVAVSSIPCTIRHAIDGHICLRSLKLASRHSVILIWLVH